MIQEEADREGDRVVLRTNVGDVLGLRDQSDVVFGTSGQHALEPIAAQGTIVMEGIVGPHSRFVGYRLADLRAAYRAKVEAANLPAEESERIAAALEAADLAWSRTLAFFRKNLGAESGRS